MLRSSAPARRVLGPLALLALVILLLATLPAALPTAAAGLAQANARIPVLENNTGLSLAEGGAVTTTPAQLQLTDQDTPPTGLVYRLTRLPAHGTLVLAETRLTPGATFTQADIDAGRLRYTHDNSETTSDSFAFTATDGPRPRVRSVSVPNTGSLGPWSYAAKAHISADGRIVVFEAGFVGGTAGDVFAYDQATGEITQLSVNSNGEDSDGAWHWRPVVSADGSIAAFFADATNLVPGDTNQTTDIFIRDRVNEQTTRVSVSSAGEEGDGASLDPALSADGRFVAFRSVAFNLVGDNTKGQGDIFVHDRISGQTTHVSVSSAGIAGNNRSDAPKISADGRFVVFRSNATNLVLNDTNASTDIFVHDRMSGQTSRASVSSAGGQSNGSSDAPALSADGRFVAFRSDATNLVPNDTNASADIFVHDRVSGQTSRVSISSTGIESNGDSDVPTLSADGRFVAFRSDATNLVPNDTNASADIFVHDRVSGQTSRVSVNNAGEEGNGISDDPTLSADGQMLVLTSRSDNFVSGDTNVSADIFVYNQGLAATVPISITPVNDRPRLDPIGDLTLIGNTRSKPIRLSVSDDTTEAADLIVSASSNNPGVVEDGGLLLGGAGAGRTLIIEPRAGQAGQATITVAVSDGQGDPTERSFTVTVGPSPEAPTWLAMLYFAGDDLLPAQPAATGLTQPLSRALARLNTMPYNPDVRIVALFDGDRPGDSRLLIREPSGWVSPATPPPWFSAELNTGDVATLHNFLAWGRQQAPGARHTFLAVVDHGGGWAPDEGSVGQPRGDQMVAAGGWTGVSLDASANDGVGASLSTRETGEALAGLPALDVLFFDACLMSLLESAYEVAPAVDYLVAGQSILWSQLPYERYLSPNLLNAGTTPEALARNLVAAYNQGAPPDEPYAIAAWRLSALAGEGGLVPALEKLASKLLKEYETGNSVVVERAVRAAYAAAQKFDSDASYTQDATDSYIDLADFATHLAADDTLGDSAQELANSVVDAVRATVLVTKTAEGVPRRGTERWSFGGANGVGIYAPLGERDCRPSGLPTENTAQAAVAPCAAPANAKVGDLQVEPQLPYYADPAQLRLTREAPSWAALLEKLDLATPNRDPQRPGPQTPFPGDAGFNLYLPLAAR